MNAKQLGILNALVTFAAENIPGGLGEDELEVAKIVGGWALLGSPRTHNYCVANCSHFKNIAAAANAAADTGWEVVTAIPGSRQGGTADTLILRRPVWMNHPNDRVGPSF
jgi:hypothetical protein